MLYHILLNFVLVSTCHMTFIWISTFKLRTTRIVKQVEEKVFFLFETTYRQSLIELREWFIQSFQTLKKQKICITKLTCSRWISGSFSVPASLFAARTTTMLCVEIIRLLTTVGRLFDSNELTRTFRVDVFPLLRNFGESIGGNEEFPWTKFYIFFCNVAWFTSNRLVGVWYVG